MSARDGLVFLVRVIGRAGVAGGRGDTGQAVAELTGGVAAGDGREAVGQGSGRAAGVGGRDGAKSVFFGETASSPDFCHGIGERDSVSTCHGSLLEGIAEVVQG
ncbi:MAG: hypothetical protein UX09_C0056G0004 [Candidatus Uhrbacteria bacterium GW2011_GWE2_45_35]|uniref:Uncharacterized protein n=1 Tax=Candidatus Uhrbacteria bacterium GW2011_GWE2_45_35 TaxID=1618993 RepID=A0A0G1MD46_9BACT|nr:MAG: hypothetical protein UX09_C0056G0004 [Candidatus Uhrbacteria bacterium GW2011_GWE2_45_35]